MKRSLFKVVPVKQKGKFIISIWGKFWGAFCQNFWLSLPLLPSLLLASSLSLFFILLLSFPTHPFTHDHLLKQRSLSSWICLPQTTVLSIEGIISRPWEGNLVKDTLCFNDLRPGRLDSSTVYMWYLVAHTGSPTGGEVLVQEKITGTSNWEVALLKI